MEDALDFKELLAAGGARGHVSAVAGIGLVRVDVRVECHMPFLDRKYMLFYSYGKIFSRKTI